MFHVRYIAFWKLIASPMLIAMYTNKYNKYRFFLFLLVIHKHPVRLKPMTSPPPCSYKNLQEEMPIELELIGVFTNTIHDLYK